MGKMVKSVEAFDLTLQNSYTVTGTLTKSQDINNCVPFASFYASTGCDYWPYVMREIYFPTSVSGTFEIKRDFFTPATYHTVYVVEFDPAEVKVQSGIFTISGAATSTTVSGFAPVDTSRTFLVHYNRCDTSTRNVAYAAVRSDITNSGTLTFDRGGGSGNINGRWYLIEDLQGHFSVEKIDTGTISINYFNERTTPYKYHQNLFIGSWKYTGTGDENPQHAHLWAHNYHECYNYLSKYANSATVQAIVFLVNFNKSESVYMSQRHSGYLTGSTTSRTIVHQDATVSGFGMAMHTFPSMCTSYTDNGSSSQVYALCTRVTLSGLNQTVVTRSSVGSGYYVYAPHQIFDWSETARVKPAEEPKLTTLSGINSMVRSIEHLSVTFSGSDVNIESMLYANLTKGQDVANCIPFVTYRCSNSSGYPGYELIDFKMMEPDRIQLHRDGSSALHNFEIDVVEFEPDQVRVQQGWFITTSGSATATISGVDLNKSAVRAYNMTNNYTQGGQAWAGFVRTRFTNSGTLIFERGQTNDMVYGHYYVLEALDDQFTVKVHDTSGSQSWGEYLGTESPQNRTFLLNSYYLSGTTDQNPQHHFWYTQTFPHRWYLQGNKYAGGYTTYHTTYRITLKKNPNNPTNVLTQHYFSELNSSTTSRDFSLRHPVTATSGTTLLINPSPYAGGYFDSGNASYTPAAYLTYKYVDVNTVRLQRNVHNSAIIRGSVISVDFVGYELPEYTHPIHGEDDLVLSLQHDEFTISGSSYEVDYLKPIPLTKGQNIDYCVPFFTYKIDAAVSSRYMSFRPGILLDNGQYHMIKVSGGTEYFSSDIVEFNPSRVRIQQGEFHLTNASGTYNVTISGVDTTKSFLVLYWHTNAAADRFDSYAVRGRFTSASGLEFYRYETSYLQSGHWWVVESLAGDFTVDHSTFTIGSSNYATVANKGPYTDKTWNLYSFYFNSNDGNPQHIGNFGTVASRGLDIRSWVERYTSGYSPGVAMQTITFSEDSGVSAQHVVAYFQSGVDTTKTYTLPETVDMNRAIVINPNIFGPAYMDTGSIDYLLYGSCRDRLIASGTQLEMSRKGNAVLNYTTAYVLEFPENNQYYFSGLVRQQGSPVEREVRAYRRDTGELISSTTSVSGTGAFYLETTHSGDHYVVALDNEAGDVYNILGYDYVVPLTIS